MAGIIFGLATLWWSPLLQWFLVYTLLVIFLTGYYLWRPLNERLTPKFVIETCPPQATDTFDSNGQKNGWRTFFQLLPKCLTDANAEQCRGILTSIEMWDGFKNGWDLVESEVMILEWSHANIDPITLYAKAEKRLNIFSVGNRDQTIVPCTSPFPVRFFTLFNRLALRQVRAIRFHIRIVAKDVPAVDCVMKVQLGNDPFNPVIELEQDHG